MNKHTALRLLATASYDVLADMIVELHETIAYLDDDRTAYRKALAGLTDETGIMEHLHRLSQAIELLRATERPGDDPNEDRLLRAKMETERYARIKVGERMIEVYPEDAPAPLSWHDAINWCANLGEGWRLPTKDELDVLYGKRDEIGGFAYSYYWSSSEYGSSIAWLQSFLDGNRNYDYKYYYRRVRAVRSVE